MTTNVCSVKMVYLFGVELFSLTYECIYFCCAFSPQHIEIAQRMSTEIQESVKEMATVSLITVQVVLNPLHAYPRTMHVCT